MKRSKVGFTLIEVALFLAITGLLFIGITIGVNSSVYRQRYNDAIQDFTEFLRGVYAETMNVQGIDTGRSGYAIYGKLVTFGETVALDAFSKTDENTVFVYDVVGSAKGDLGGNDVLTSLRTGVKADVIIDNPDGGKKLAGIVDTYRPRWTAQLQPGCTGSSCSYTAIKAALLIVRHPQSGNVFTFVKNGTIEVNKKRKTNAGSNSYSVLTEYLDSSNFKVADFNVCINPEGEQKYDNRSNVRINSGAKNSSAIVNLNEADKSDNACYPH